MRIISGEAKGRRLVAPGTAATRPATDRVRQAVFSSLGEAVVGTDVLDLYAGSGSYGLEALSRGARSAVFVEQGRKALDALRRNIAAVGLGGRAVSQEVGAFLASPAPDSYDLVFIDPPWDLPIGLLDSQLALIEPLLTPGGEVVVSRREGDAEPTPPSAWQHVVTRRHGDATIHRYRSQEEGGHT